MRDKQYVYSAAYTVIENLMSITPDHDYGVSAESIEKLKTVISHDTPKDKQRSIDIEKVQYIPQSVVDEYINRFTESDSEQKILLYKELSRMWLNTPTLFDVIEKDILNRYLATQDKKEIKELAEGIKMLSMTGMTRYKETLEIIAKNTEGNKKLKSLNKVAKKGPEWLADRHRIARTVHNPETMNPEQSWQVNQRVNLIRSDEFPLLEKTAKEIYQHDLKNKYVLDILSDILLEESTQRSYRANFNAGFYSWICRILGSSKQVEYKPVLEQVSKEAKDEKVREYARKYL